MKEFIEALAKKLDIQRKELIEKEFYRFVQKLQEQLRDIVQELSATISYERDSL